LTGANHTSPNPNDAVTQGAKAALTNAYNNAAGQTPTIINTELAGQTLAPGVYTSASGTFGMSGTLTLDGQNNAGAVFIFQTASTLITGGTGNVILIRGAQSCNVFWKVGSSATLGAGSTLNGTILANTSISLGSGVTVLGRLLAGEQASGAGAVTLIHDTIIRSVCAATPVVTPTATPTPTPKPTTAAASASAAAVAAAAASASAKAAAVKAAAAKAAAAAAPAATPTGAQILRVPVGAVHTGDGSMSKSAAQPPYLGGALAIIAVGAVAGTVVARRRRHRA
ncbi:MAG TPA: ice-binding family protein, partial [Acidothermaceae bacterium]|nr:ice-binding family protein [Acidothermaceae bacterium]